MANLLLFKSMKPMEHQAKRRIMDTIEMPDQMVENLIRFIRLNEGKLGRKRREGEFAPLTDQEVRDIEAIVEDAFAGIR